MLMLGSCNISKTIPKDDKLYTGAKVVSPGIKINKSIIEELESTIRPKPNSKFLGFFPKLMVNSSLDPNKKKGFVGRMLTKFAEPPVLLSQVSIQDNRKRLTNILFARGYLQSEINPEVKSNDFKAWIVYNIKPGTRYTLRNIIYPSDSSAISKAIDSVATSSKLKKGNYFDFDDLKNERARIDKFLKEQGYFFYIPEYILFRADSLHAGTTDVYLTLIPDMPDNAKKTWQIGDVSIYGNYTQERDSLISKMTGKKEKEFTIIDKQERYRSDLYTRTVLLKEGQLYQKSLQTTTIERLMNLQNFRFVRTVFFPDTMSNILATRIYLTPSKKRTLRFEVSGESKSNNFLGSSVGLKYRNLNLFKGAEIFEAKINYGYDFQVGGNQQSARASNFSGDLSLFVPKLLPAFRIKTRKDSFVPRTAFSLGFEYVKRPELYTLRSFKLSTGYYWKVGKTTDHNLRIININSVEPSNISDSFNNILNSDPQLKASFEKQLIIGSKYQFTYNNTYRERKFNYIADLQFGVSGNIASLLSSAQVDTPGAKMIGGVPIAQFFRSQADLRGYLQINKRTSWANRFIIGAAFAYGNSTVPPYSEQFFIGGSSSLRAFRIRTLGPGSFYSPESVYQANESGEFKVEMNSEIRYDLWKFVKLAAFADAGNIWFFKDAPGKPGSGLSGDVLKEMAVGAGFGLRIDVSVLAVRFDFAIPIRKPWYPEKDRWVFNEIDFGNKAWRNNNIILNIGIGYPF